MSSGKEYIHAEKYESGEVKLFAESSKEEPQNLAFLSPVMIGTFENSYSWQESVGYWMRYRILVL